LNGSPWTNDIFVCDDDIFENKVGTSSLAATMHELPKSTKKILGSMLLSLFLDTDTSAKKAREFFILKYGQPFK
jgi:uncharacterized protein YbcI